MNKKNLILLLVTAIIANAAFSQQKKSGKMENSQQKQQVAALLKSLETGDPAPVSVINQSNYTQHNLAIADGFAGLGALLQQLPKGATKVNTVRTFQDGNYVFAQTDYNFFGPKTGIDIFRFQDGKIVEHWDNLQQTPESPNPSGHTMIDGNATLTDADKTGENKKIVSNFVNDILVNGKVEKLSSYIDGDNYIQHNPQIGDGLSGLGKALEAMAKQGITMKYNKVHKVLGEGNFVLTVSEGSFAGKATSFYDLFRVENGKIAEHWDVIETISPESEWKNNNGKFNFPE